MWALSIRLKQAGGRIFFIFEFRGCIIQIDKVRNKTILDEQKQQAGRGHGVDLDNR